MPVTRWLLALALMMGLIVNASGTAFSQGPPAPRRDPDRHPHLRSAMRDLRQAANQLEHADHDFGGHRVKALELVKQAEGQLREALEWAKAHPDSAEQSARPAGVKPQ